MRTLDELRRDVEAAAAAYEAAPPNAAIPAAAQVDAARLAYLEADPGGPTAAEMRYRLGLSRLMNHRDRAGAQELFKLAAAERGAPVAPEARVSLALLLHADQKTKAALFELRKLVPEGAAPTIHTAQALDFISLFLRDQKAPLTELIAVDTQRIEHLSVLAKNAADLPLKAHFLLRLAAAHADGGTGQDLALARQALDQVLRLGPKAGADALDSARQATKALPKR